MDTEHFLARHGAMRTENDKEILEVKKAFFLQWKLVSLKPRLYVAFRHMRPQRPSLARKLWAGVRIAEQREEIRAATSAWDTEKRQFEWEFDAGREAVRSYIEEMGFPERGREQKGQAEGLQLVYQVDRKGYEFTGQAVKEEETEMSWQTACEEEGERLIR